MHITMIQLKPQIYHALILKKNVHCVFHFGSKISKGELNTLNPMDGSHMI